MLSKTKVHIRHALLRGTQVSPVKRRELGDCFDGDCDGMYVLDVL